MTVLPRQDKRAVHPAEPETSVCLLEGTLICQAIESDTSSTVFQAANGIGDGNSFRMCCEDQTVLVMGSFLYLQHETHFDDTTPRLHYT
jgi:hypothetical protein